MEFRSTRKRSLVSGINARSNDTNTLDQSTLARATLSGSNVNITATTGDVNLIAPTINATQGVTLNATKGAVNFDVVNTTTEVSQDKGGKSLIYQRTSDSGVHTEAANYTQINSPNLTVDASQVNVRVGVQGTIVPGGSGLPSQFVPTQSLQRGLSQMINSAQPGMSWVNQLQTDHSLDDKIYWQGVPVGQRAWAEGQGSLTQTGAAVVTIVATVLTWGYGAEFVGAAGDTVTGAAANAGLSTLAGHAAVSLIDNNGDIGATLHDLGSSRTIKDIVTAMATAGAVQGLNVGLGMQGWTTAGVGAGTASWTQVLGRNLLDSATAGLVYSAVNGTSAEQGIQNGLLNGFLNTAAAGSANWIGDNGPNGNGNLNALTAAVAHAIVGCAIGAGRSSASGANTANGCGAGAAGAVAGSMATEFLLSNGTADTNTVINLAQVLGGVAGALVGGDAESANIGAQASINSAVNNELNHLPGTAEERLRAAGFVPQNESNQPISPANTYGFVGGSLWVLPVVAGVAVTGSGQVFLQLGFGNPGPSAQVGITTNGSAADYLTGWSGSISPGLVGAGASRPSDLTNPINTPTAVIFGTPGVSATYGFQIWVPGTPYPSVPADQRVNALTDMPN